MQTPQFCNFRRKRSNKFDKKGLTFENGCEIALELKFEKTRSFCRTQKNDFDEFKRRKKLFFCELNRVN